MSKKIQITESDIQNMVTRCAKMLMENVFSNYLDKVRTKYYIQGKKKGLTGEELERYTQEKMSDFMAKDQALKDFKKDLRKEHPNHLEDDEFYGNSETMADTWGFEMDPSVDEED